MNAAQHLLQSVEAGQTHFMSEMEDVVLDFVDAGVSSFVVLPYLTTSETVFLCGFELHPASDTDHLPEEAKDHWTKISQLFYLRDHLRITDLTYIYLSPELDADRVAMAKKLRMLQACLSYIYTSSSTRNRTPFLRWEHMSLFWLRPSRLSDYQIWPKHKTHNELPLEQRPAVDDRHDMEGYRGLLNGKDDVEAVAGSRIYPSVRDLWFNMGQDVALDVMMWDNLTANWALRVFFERDEPFIARDPVVTERIVNAIEWHNRSTSLLLSEEEAVLYLAIAFEALLNLEDGAGVTERFKGTVKTLLGSVDRLDWWADQFYTARSKIVHRGRWHHLGFYPVDSKAHRQIVSAKTPDKESRPIGSLLAYGRHIFRLCVQSIVHASVLSWETNLSQTLVSNEDRLKELLEKLKNVTQTPTQRLQAVVPIISDLHELSFPDDSTVQAALLVGAAKRLVEIYLELNPTDLPSEVAALLNRFTTSAKLAEHLECIRKLADALDEWKCPDAPHTRYGLGEAQKNDPISVVWSFCDYFRFKAWNLQGML